MASASPPLLSKRKHWIRAGIVLCLLIMLVVVVVNFFVFSFNAPTYEELAVEARSVAGSARIEEEPTRHDHAGAVLEGSQPEARVSVSRTGRREDVYSQLVQSVEQKGYSRIESLDESNFLSSKWRKGKIEVSIFVRGVRDQAQALEVGISAMPFTR
jgi:hypothetical protein